MNSTKEDKEFYQTNLPNSIACMVAQVVSMVLFGLTKSYLNSKPLGMQSLYDVCSKLCINCFLIMVIVNFILILSFVLFWPLDPYISVLLALVSYVSVVFTFVSLFCVQFVRYLYFAYPIALDYYDENKTVCLFILYKSYAYSL